MSCCKLKLNYKNMFTYIAVSEKPRPYEYGITQKYTRITCIAECSDGIESNRKNRETSILTIIQYNARCLAWERSRYRVRFIIITLLVHPSYLYWTMSVYISIVTSLFLFFFRFEDIFNTSEFRERMGQPHAVLENRLGIL